MVTKKEAKKKIKDYLESVNYHENKGHLVYISPPSNIKELQKELATPRYKLLHPDAKPPTKGGEAAEGWDLTLIGFEKVIYFFHGKVYEETLWEREEVGAGSVVYFKTGLQIEPPEGIMYKMYPRSSLSKTGWMLANGVAIIDEDYRGEILVPLIKIAPQAPFPKLPGRYVQLVAHTCVREQEPWTEQLEEWEETERGDKGFGSSGLT